MFLHTRSCFSGHFYADVVDPVGYLPNIDSLLPFQQNLNFDQVSTPSRYGVGEVHLQAQVRVWTLIKPIST